MINPARGNRNRAETVIVDQNRNRAGFIAKYHSYLYLRPFSYSGISWRGSSRILVKACIDFSRRFCISVLPEKPDSCDFCLAVSWVVDGVVYRRKLWTDVEEICYWPQYTNEIISPVFYLEIWTTPLSTVTLLENLQIILSIHDIFAFAGELASHTYSGCTDKLLDFTSFDGTSDTFITEACPSGAGSQIGQVFYTDEDGNVYVDVDGVSGYTP